MLACSAFASEKSSGLSVKFVGAVYFPLEGQDNPKGIIATYLVMTPPGTDHHEHKQKYIKRVVSWACNNRHFKGFLDIKTEHRFTQVHIFLAQEPPKYKKPDKPTHPAFGEVVQLDGFEYVERAFSIVDGKCGLEVDPRTKNDHLKNSLARYLYGGPG